MLTEALRLSPEERAALAGELIQSLDTEVDPDAEAAWAEEIRARLGRLEAGDATTIPWSEAQNFRATGEWGLRIVGQQGRFVFGVYRRQMRAISYLAQLDQLFGVPVTTRNWSTITALARLLEAS